MQRITITPKSLEAARNHIASLQKEAPAIIARLRGDPPPQELAPFSLAALIAAYLKGFADPDVAIFAKPDDLQKTIGWAERLCDMLRNDPNSWLAGVTAAENAKKKAEHDALVDEDGVYQGSPEEHAEAEEVAAAYVRDVDQPGADDAISAWESQRLNDAIRQQRWDLVPERFRDTLPVEDAMRHEELRQAAKRDPRRPAARSHKYSLADIVRKTGYTRGTVSNWLNVPSHTRPLLPAYYRTEGLRRRVEVKNVDLFDWAYVYHPSLIEKVWGPLKTE